MQTMLLSSSSLPHLSLPPIPPLSFPTSFPSFPKFKKISRPGVVLFPSMCIPGPTSNAETSKDAEKTQVSSSSFDFSTYSWSAGLRGLGFLETTYLSSLKLPDTEPLVLQ